MNLLNDVITYIRRIIKTPNNTDISDDLLIDYINRFWIMDVDARIQLFDLKKKYSFITQPGVDKYNMPLYDLQVESGSQNINFYPVYQGFLPPVYVNGIPISFHTQKNAFFNIFPKVTQYVVLGTGDGGSTYNLNINQISNSTPLNPPITALLRGHVDITGVIATGNNVDPPEVSDLNLDIPVTSVDSAVYLTAMASDGSNIVVADSGQFLLGDTNYGLLMNPGKAPLGNSALSGGYSTTVNTINYLTGEINVTFPASIPSGANIYGQYYLFQSGLPRAMLYYDNTITLRMPPAQQYLVELEGYLTPAAYLQTSDAIQFAYMSEYIARGAARKIMSDTGDVEQLQFYEPFFIEQERLVWKRSQRQWTSTRTQTIYSQGMGQGFDNAIGNFGGLA